MPSLAFEHAVHRAAERAVRSFGVDIRRLREDAGIPRAVLARQAGIDRSHLRRIEEGETSPSIEASVRLTLALGADLSLRAYPNTGSPIRDRHQAPIEESLLRLAHPRWGRYSEVAVRRPARGWIDIGLYSEAERLFVAIEIESAPRRLEQLIRWHGDKAASLPSWTGWSHLATEPTVSMLLIVRDTRANRELAASSRRLLRAVYPSDPRDALEALAGSAIWPGSALLWAVRNGARTPTPYRIVARP